MTNGTRFLLVVAIFLGAFLTLQGHSFFVYPTVALTNSATDIGVGNYDTFESPQGTPYEVPAGRTLVITTVISANGLMVVIGYGDDDVQDSATPPTNAVVVCYTSGDVTDYYCPIPEGKFPFVLITGGTPPPVMADNIQATGEVR